MIDEHEVKPLSGDEIRDVRKLLEAEKRMNWFWATIRIWGSYIAGAIVGVWAVIEVLGKIVRGKVGN